MLERSIESQVWERRRGTSRCIRPAGHYGFSRSTALQPRGLLSLRVRLHNMFTRIRLCYWKRRYRPGRVVSRFLVPDVRREIEVVDASRLDAGLIVARMRTWNVLYAARGLAPAPPFGDAR